MNQLLAEHCLAPHVFSPRTLPTSLYECGNSARYEEEFRNKLKMFCTYIWNCSEKDKQSYRGPPQGRD